MTKVEKNGEIMVARDKNQLAAFLNNGWTISAEEETPKSLGRKPKATTVDAKKE